MKFSEKIKTLITQVSNINEDDLNSIKNDTLAKAIKIKYDINSQLLISKEARLLKKEQELSDKELRLNEFEDKLNQKDIKLNKDEIEIKKFKKKQVIKTNLILITATFLYVFFKVIILNPNVDNKYSTYSEVIPIIIPSDLKALYFIVDRGVTGKEHTIVTKRVGATSGMTYSNRLYNCIDRTVKYLGTGGTLYEMDKSEADKNMTPIVEGSIAYYVGIEACKD